MYSYGRCRNCGRSFAVTNGEAEFYRKKGFNFPTKCADCRARR
nr:zinc-ribbon domain containing protein [uncultured Ruminococcus sp.]